MSDAPALPRITGYELLEELGRGGMATVYVARQQALNRQVAIKVVHPKRKDDEAWVLRLENEAQALAGLHHPHIVDVYEFGRTDDDALYYVMPLLRGGDLTRWQLPVAEDRVTALLDDLLDALAHAHVQGIVHRDIKPENILFDTERRPHLADFGAALRPSKSRLTGEGMVMGSTGYMSPEQARGQDVDARSDLYSLAVVAFELLTGKPPFGGADDLAIALRRVAIAEEEQGARRRHREGHGRAGAEAAVVHVAAVLGAGCRREGLPQRWRDAEAADHRLKREFQRFQSGRG